MNYKQMLAAAFTLNGMSMLMIKSISEFRMGKAMFLILVCMYMAGAVGNFAVMRRGSVRVKWSSVMVGLLGGLGSGIGMAFSSTAAGMIPGYVVFPLVNGGTLFLVAMAGRIFFKERIGPYGYAGIAVGIAAIVLLNT